MGNDTNDESNANKPAREDYEAMLTNAWVALDRAQQERAKTYRSWRYHEARNRGGDSAKTAEAWRFYQVANNAERQAADFYDTVQMAMIAQQAGADPTYVQPTPAPAPAPEPEPLNEDEAAGTLAQRIDDATDCLARAADVNELGEGDVATGYLIAALAELIELAKAQQAAIARLSAQLPQ